MAREREFGLDRLLVARVKTTQDIMRKSVARKIDFKKMRVFAFDALQKELGNNNCFCNCDYAYEDQCDGCDKPSDRLSW